MKILIVDDEAPARERLRRLSQEIGNHTVVGEAANGIEAVQLFNKHLPDVVLLDIRMPVVDGMETARHLTQYEPPPAIIFTTAYGDHALEAFETHAVDYLLKPVRKERLEEALNATHRMTRAKMNEVAETEGLNPEARQHICVRHRGNLELIAIEDIFYFYAEHKYVTIHHTQGESLIEGSLVSLEKEFGTLFLRVHRNCLIAVKQLLGLEKATTDGSYKVALKDCREKIEVSRRHLATVRKLLKKIL